MKKSTEKKKKKTGKIILGIICIFLALSAAVFAVCMIPMKTYDVDPALYESGGGITVTDISSNITAFVPEKAETGLIFFQGARVDAKAYVPLMRKLAEKNVLTVLIDCPFNLAFFGMNSPDGLKEKFPQITSWYIGGHSMGAEVAGEYLNKNPEGFDGLALFAGFVTNDFSGTDLKAVSVYGENDGVLTGGLYESCLSHLPEDFSEYVIKGGNHSGFAYYGPQKGDNEAEISKDEQIAAAAEFIANELNK